MVQGREWYTHLLRKAITYDIINIFLLMSTTLATTREHVEVFGQYIHNATMIRVLYNLHRQNGRIVRFENIIAKNQFKRHVV